MTQKVDGLKYRPKLDFIWVADFGQPDKSPGGLYLGDSSKDFGRYKFDMWRYGEVISIGPGRPTRPIKRRPAPTLDFAPMPDIKIGDVIMFSRKHGTRLPGDMRYEHPKYGSLLMRVLDPMKTAAVVTEFEPWWNVRESQLDPSGEMTG